MTEWNAKEYAQISGLQNAMAAEVLGRLALEGSEQALDIGCGNGRITAEIARRLPRGSVLGVDPSSEMIAFATRQYATAEHPNLRFQAGDVRKLNLGSDFDLIVSFNALHWVPEQQLALRSIHQALRPAGRALLRFVPKSEHKCLEDVIEEVRNFPQWAAYFGEFRKPYLHLRPDEYRQLARQAGFEVVRLEVDEREWDFGSREAVHAFCRVTFAEWTRRLPERDWDEFIEEVLDLYEADPTTAVRDAHTFKFDQLEIELMRA